MNRQKVDSTNIKSIGYDSQSQVLEVEFKSGQIYQYEGIEPELHQSIIGAESIGSNFHAKVVKGGFKSKKL